MSSSSPCSRSALHASSRAPRLQPAHAAWSQAGGGGISPTRISSPLFVGKTLLCKIAVLPLPSSRYRFPFTSTSLTEVEDEIEDLQDEIRREKRSLTAIKNCGHVEDWIILEVVRDVEVLERGLNALRKTRKILKEEAMEQLIKSQGSELYHMLMTKRITSNARSYPSMRWVSMQTWPWIPEGQMYLQEAGRFYTACVQLTQKASPLLSSTVLLVSFLIWPRTSSSTLQLVLLPSSWLTR